jgi:uncharacterized protein
MNDEFVPKDRLLLVSISKTIETLSVYDAARYAWRVNRRRVEGVDLVLACDKGIVKGVYKPSQWMDASPGEATKTNFPGLTSTHNGQRWGFEGEEAGEAAQLRYLEKRVPRNLAIGQAGLRYFDNRAE